MYNREMDPQERNVRVLDYASPPARPRGSLIILTLAIAFLHVAVYGVCAPFLDRTWIGRCIYVVMHPLLNSSEYIHRTYLLTSRFDATGRTALNAAALSDCLAYGFAIALLCRFIARRRARIT